jgi:hypothetical protein
LDAKAISGESGKVPDIAALLRCATVRIDGPALAFYGILRHHSNQA